MEQLIDETKNNPPQEPHEHGTLKDKTGVILCRDDYHYAFSTEGYLRDFYDHMDEPAMKAVLSYLPSLVTRIPSGKRMLDIGSGPTIHVAVAFRYKVDEIYLSDYLPNNRSALVDWLNRDSSFDWTKPLSILGVQENLFPVHTTLMEEVTRTKVKGILHSDVFEKKVVTSLPDEMVAQGFDVVSSFFTIEYCCKTEDEYREAITNAVRMVKPNGWFLMGGILEDDWFTFNGVQFSFLYITERLMIETLASAGLDTINDFHFLNDDGLFMVTGRKLTHAEYTQRVNSKHTDNNIIIDEKQHREE